MHRDDDDPVTPWAVAEIAEECLQSSFQRFIRENYGLYSPPADYAAIRRENMKRTYAVANRTSFGLVKR